MVSTVTDNSGSGIVVAAVGCGHYHRNGNDDSLGAIQCVHNNQNEIRSNADYEGEGQESKINERNPERH